MNVFAAVGMALSQWERLEAVLAWVFSEFVSSGSRLSVAQRAYGSVRTFEGRAAMLRAAAAAAFHSGTTPGGHKRAFDKVVGNALQAVGRRNEIAHGVVLFFDAQDASVFGSREGFLLVPASYTDKTKNDGAPQYAYNSGELKRYAGQFESLRNPATRLWLDIKDLPLTPLPKPSAR